MSVYLYNKKSFRVLVLTFMLTIFISISYGQGFSYPVIRSSAQHIIDFVPAGWQVLDSAYGDLNKDAISDAVIILQLKDSTSLVNSLQDTILAQPRVLLILFKNPTDNNFTLMEQSNSFILMHDNADMNDPYHDLSINKGVLEISFSLQYNIGSWYITNVAYMFRYQQRQFVLIGADNFSFHKATHDFEDRSYNFLTRKRSLTKGNEDKGTKKTSWKALNITQLKTFRTFTEPFSWEVEKDTVL